MFFLPPAKPALCFSINSARYCILSLQSILKEKEDGTSQWSEPAFVFCPVACNAWPVAEITVQKKEDGSETITIRQRITNVAMILQTKPCPLTTVGAFQK